MKLIILPAALLLFAFFCLCGLHIDNINKLENLSKERKMKLNSLKVNKTANNDVVYTVQKGDQE
ncbi:hypothetical protein NBT05_12135 [Aquimarina sp. ERC-38]|uniref:hypothetical protein n=1 Tax=Aquimarina sp. ERC-38 TaxID=2949996 RepID=UPI002246C2B5|nr:hypothetical protein [Aquimarina sp. ERC-38]UZO79700.1 hypothetical protein NBT05_12135 [Aquimarina sp. ERC-38]